MDSICTGRLVRYSDEYGDVFEHPGEIHYCPVCGPIADELDEQDERERTS